MIGRLIDGRYQVRSRIARGGMATVYLATDLRLERRVALKIMHGHLADDSQFKERFIQEARSAARLAHPNVVNVFDQGQDNDMAYLVMEFLSGITLRDLLTEHRVLTSEQTLDILEAVLSGLAAAHKSGIVHRDLKPENVLLADDGRIKIGDFGLARAVSANTATGAALLGTIAYLSPELVTRGIADARSDIYAVGIMMYEMLAGEQPFRGEQPMQIAYQHANDSVPTPSTKNPNVPAELDELVLWATARDPEERPRDARVMLDQLIETQNQLQTALPTGATAIQRTTVLPTALAKSGTGDQTQVLRAAPLAAPTASGVSEATDALARQSGRRRSRAVWWVLLFIIVAALAGGTGWYFGVGPGSQVTIPTSIVNQSPADASAALEELGLTVSDTTTEVSSSTVPVGAVAGADPDAGTSVTKSTVVTLEVSTGPKPVAIPQFIGISETDATDLATGLDLEVGEPERQFSGDVAAGVVMAAYGVDAADARVNLAEGDTYYESMPVTFLVSVGPIPAVEGLTVDEAVARLDAVELNGVPQTPEFHPTVPSGQVIQLRTQTDDPTIRPGDSLNLIVSKGPDLVDVPDVEDDTINSARATLVAAGFVVVVQSNVPAAFWDIATVTELTPVGPGEKLIRGGTITIIANY
jgi:beta-lactam-binding protein with PASTA domain/tRNA A-37 threonylcarbamoyl transferase component Bud32